MWGFLNQFTEQKLEHERLERLARMRMEDAKQRAIDQRLLIEYYAKLAEFNATYGAIARRCPIPSQTVHWVN